ncbi:DUF3592 domain-containing protein [Actinopolymorpha sp. B11F2]|uniref:DUF3592 domain-containing protein n=1 Tax=Actinopolymorpha sp. B11F2 TaxID=3160862 RepID=UPI0032E3804B
MNKGRLYALLGGIFGLVGSILLVVTVWVVVSTVSFLSSAERLDGKVVELTEQTSSSSGSNGSGTAWYPTVEFTVDGETYSFQSSQGSNPPAYEVGDTVEVAYDPDDPNDARLASVGAAYFVPLITGGLGIVFTPIGVTLFVKGRRILAQRAWLRRNGREIWAEIAHIGLEFNIRVNGRHPYVVHATWHDDQSGRTYTATSDYVRRDPGPGLRGQTHVRVLYDPADPDRNLLELGTRPT